MGTSAHSIALNARFLSHRPTGMQRYALELASRFQHELDVIRPARALRGPAGHLWEQAYLPTACHGRLLWSPNNTGPVAISRQVCTIHDLIPLDRPEWFTPSFSRWYRWLFPRLARRVRHIIAVSEFTKQRIVELLKVAPERITVILNGVDGRFTPRPRAEIEALRLDLKISGLYLLSVGSLEPRKNIRRLLEAWRQILPALADDVELVIAGASGDPRVFADAGVPTIPDRVRFLGYVPDERLPALYSGALALVYPTLYEGFGLPPLEAMACGTPVVTSNNTSLPEVAGEAALLVDPLDPSSIADGIGRMLTSAEMREGLGRAGLDRARKLSWDETARLTREVLLNHC